MSGCEDQPVALIRCTSRRLSRLILVSFSRSAFLWAWLSVICRRAPEKSLFEAMVPWVI